MEIAVVGTPEFTLGFQLAGVRRLHNPEGDEELATTMRQLLNQKGIGIVVIDKANPRFSHKAFFYFIDYS